MHLTAAQLGELFEGAAAKFIVFGEYGESHKHLIGVEAGVLAAQIFNLGLLDRLYHALRDEFGFVVDASQMLGRIEQEGGTASEQG